MSRQDFDSSEILVRDIMTKAIISVPGETTVFQVAKMMEQGGIGAVLVKKGSNLHGIITDRDYADRKSTRLNSSHSSVSRMPSSA